MDWKHCWKHLTTPFLSTSSVDMVGFINPHNVVVLRNTFSTLANAQNENVLKMKIKSFDYGRLKCPFSQVEWDSYLQEIAKPTPLLKKRTTRKKMIVITMKKEEEESEKVGKKWVND